MVSEADSDVQPRPQVPRQRSLLQQVKLARLWLPLTIVGVVVLHQLLVVTLGNEAWQFWSQLLFYSIVGPIATYITLNWIATEVQLREQAQDELAGLYHELRESHELLSTIQTVTERFASATDLEGTLEAASQGITRVTGARGVAVLLGTGQPGVTHGLGIDPELSVNAIERNRAVLAGQPLPEILEIDGNPVWVLTMPLAWAGGVDGSLHAYFEQAPDSRAREAFSILASEFAAAAEAARSRTRDLLTLFAVDRSIRAEGNLERLLETLLTQMLARAEVPLGGVYLADEGGMFRLKASLGLQPSGVGTPVRIGEGLLGRVVRLARPQVFVDLEPQDRQSGGPILRQAGSALLLPLLAEEGVLGLVVLAHPEPGRFDEESVPFLSLLAGQVSLAVRNARAYLQSEELAIAEERARIAREIHDGVAQSLAFTALKLDLVTRLLPRDPAKAAWELDRARTTTREMIREVRRSIFALRPVDLERHGFIETIRRYSSDFGQQNDVRVELDIADLPELSLKSEAALFRIFQEALNNVAKHSRANRVRLEVGCSPEGQAFIAVTDDGCGFDLDAVSDRVTSAGGLGLRQMRERIESRGGVFRIRTAVGHGTSLYASVPD